jgi:hypothetical protein
MGQMKLNGNMHYGVEISFQGVQCWPLKIFNFGAYMHEL